MKVQCPKCSTSYRLPKGKAPSGGFKVRCKNCGHVIDVAAGEPEAPAAESETRWFIAAGNEKQGPFASEEIERRLSAGEATPNTLVWRKGFKSWTRIADLEEFQEQFAAAGEGDDATQLMPLAGIGGEPSGAATGHEAPAAEGGEDAAGDHMVWQRRDTSVLFSLDDYKVRKRTQQTPAIQQPDSLIPVTSADLPAAAPAEAAKPAPKVGLISLDESEIRQVAESLARRKQQRRTLIIVVGGAALAAIVVVAVVLMMNRAPTPSPVPQAPTPVAGTATEPAPAAAPAPAPAPTPAATAEAPAAEAAEAAAPAAEGEKPAEVAKEAAEAEKPVEKAAETEPAPAPEKKTSTASRSSRRTRSETAPEPKPEPKPTAAAPNVVDANTLLAQYKGGKAGGDAKADGGDSGSGGADASNLPVQLSMSQVASVLRKKQGAVDNCVKSAGLPVPFRVNSRVVIDGSGSVASATAAGSGAAEACIIGVLRSVRFPKFKGDDMTVPFPFTVR